MECLNRACRKELPADAFFCTWCGEYAGAPGVGVKANLFARWIALMIDPLIGIVLWLLPSILFGAISRDLGLIFAVLFPLGYVVYYLWHLWLLRQGKTLGKMLMGLQVVDQRTSNIPGFGKMVLLMSERSFRWLFCAIGVLALLAPTPSRAQSPATEVGSTVLPQFAFGGGWYSALYFSNLNDGNVSFTLTFISDNGSLLTVPSLGGSSKQVSLVGHGTTIVEAPNEGDLNQGYATFTLPGGVIGYGVFRQSVPGRADQEAVVPFSSSASTATTLTWDDTNLTTAVAVVNPSASTAAISITGRNENGTVVGTASFALPPFNKTESTLGTIPGLAGIVGHRGSAQFTASSGDVAVLGLRFNGSAFTSIPTGPTGITAAPSSFQSGKYVGPSTIANGKATVTVAGPGVADAGATVWSLSAASGADRCTYPNTATWYVGLIENNPLAGRLKKAGITSTAYSYGIGASPSNCYNYQWSTDTLIGVSQVGDTLTLVSFTNNGQDSSTPVDQITYTLAAPQTFTPQSVSTFQTGPYLGPGTVANGKAAVTVDGPGNSGGGVVQWSLSAASGADRCTYPNTATWYVGPIENNPYAARLKSAGITSAAYSYGVGGSPSNCYNYQWSTDTLIGVSQAGNTLTLVSFTNNGQDYSTPVDEITYTLASP